MTDMACCYIAASMIAFFIRSCDALDINLHLQYNESARHAYDDHGDEYIGERRDEADERRVLVVSISGMTCAACTVTVEAALKGVQGVSEALVSLPFQEARVLHDGTVKVTDVVGAVEAVGYDAVLGEREASQKVHTLRHTEELAALRASLKGLSVYSGVIFALGTLLDYADISWGLHLQPIRATRPIVLFCLTAYTASRDGRWIFKNAASAARRLNANMHTLIAASTLVGLSLTLINMFASNPRPGALYHDTIVGVLLIITAGRYMDLLSRRRANDTFAGLYSLLDQTSSVKLAKLNVSCTGTRGE